MGVYVLLDCPWSRNLAHLNGKKPPKVNLFHRLLHQFSYSEEEEHYDVPLMIAGDAEEKEEKLIGLIKYSDWSYERELRAFYPSHGMMPTDLRVLNASDSIQGLIFGPRMTDDDKERAVLCCHLMKASQEKAEASASSEQSLISFFEARSVINRFGFDIIPVGVLAGHYYDGHIPLKPVSKLDDLTTEHLMKMAAQISSNK